MFRKLLQACLFVALLGTSIYAKADDCCSSSGHLFLEADYLYWRACEDGLEYLRYQRVPISTRVQTKTSRITTLQPDFEWKSGFRVGLGYQMCSDGWYNSLTWTHFRNKSSESEIKPFKTGFLYYLIKRDNLIQPSPAFDFVDSFKAFAEWKLDYDILDWEFGAPFCLCKWFRVTPFIGARGALINQRFDNKVITRNGTLVTTRSECIKNDYNAGGVRAGLDLQLNMCPGFSIYGNAAGSILYGRFKVDDYVFSNANRFLANSSTKPLRVRPNFEGAFGLQWVLGLCDSQYFTLRVGYELVYWFDQNQIPGQIQPDISKSSSLSFQGLQVQALFDF